jgi:multiple sugar transport system ATP-binding protein
VRKSSASRSGRHAADQHLLDRRPAQLSGGQRQRVAMGRALARDPQLFLFDEPLSNLDAKLRVEMRAEIKRLHQVSGITSVYVTHDQIEAMTLGTRIAVMKDGILQQIGTPDEIYRLPGQHLCGRIHWLAHHEFHVQGNVTLGQRPEHIHLADDANWRGEVTLVEPTGADTYVVIRTGVGLITVRTPPSTQVKVGDNVGLSVSANHNNWFDVQTGQRLG